MKTWTVPFTVNIPEHERPFDDGYILQRMEAAAPKPGGSKVLRVAITGKERDSASCDYVIRGELTLGR